jgi:hypothetical protein
MGRKSPLFAHLNLSPDPRIAELKEEIGKSLRPNPRIFPFCGDYRRRRVRSGLPPDGAVGFENPSPPQPVSIEKNPRGVFFPAASACFRIATRHPTPKAKHDSSQPGKFIRRRLILRRRALSNHKRSAEIANGGSLIFLGGPRGPLFPTNRHRLAFDLLGSQFLRCFCLYHPVLALRSR